MILQTFALDGVPAAGDGGLSKAVYESWLTNPSKKALINESGGTIQSSKFYRVPPSDNLLYLKYGFQRTSTCKQQSYL